MSDNENEVQHEESYLGVYLGRLRNDMRICTVVFAL